MGRLNERGEEVPDDTPVALPVGFKAPESLQDQIRRLIHTELSNQAQDAGMETFEEADDFEVGDDYDPHSPYELDENQEVEPTPSKRPPPDKPLEQTAPVEKTVDKPVEKGVDNPSRPPQA